MSLSSSCSSNLTSMFESAESFPRLMDEQSPLSETKDSTVDHHLVQRHSLGSALLILPPEILGYLFRICIKTVDQRSHVGLAPQTSINQAIRLSHVCALWRAICTTDSQIWSKISLDLSVPLASRALITLLPRSRKQALDLSMSITRGRGDHDDILLTLLLGVLPRLETLNLHFDAGLFCSWERLLRSGRRFPQLRCLNLRVLGSSLPPYIVAPNLQELEFAPQFPSDSVDTFGTLIHRWMSFFDVASIRSIVFNAPRAPSTRWLLNFESLFDHFGPAVSLRISPAHFRVKGFKTVAQRYSTEFADDIIMPSNQSPAIVERGLDATVEWGDWTHEILAYLVNFHQNSLLRTLRYARVPCTYFITFCEACTPEVDQGGSRRPVLAQLEELMLEMPPEPWTRPRPHDKGTTPTSGWSGGRLVKHAMRRIVEAAPRLTSGRIECPKLRAAGFSWPACREGEVQSAEQWHDGVRWKESTCAVKVWDEIHGERDGSSSLKRRIPELDSSNSSISAKMLEEVLVHALNMGKTQGLTIVFENAPPELWY